MILTLVRARIRAKDLQVISEFDADGNFLAGKGMDMGGNPFVDSNGNMYLVGQFAGTQDFDPGPGTDIHVANGVRDAFVIKLDPSGNYLWGRSWGGPGTCSQITMWRSRLR